jgi:hypothetical protein
MLSSIDDWVKFKKALTRFEVKPDDLIQPGRACLKDVPLSLLDIRSATNMTVFQKLDLSIYKSIYNRRQSQLGSKLPTGFCPIMSTPDGNCLYNSVSVALFGSEARSVELRLSAIDHAVYHYDHYVEMVGTNACACHTIRTSDEVTLFICSIPHNYKVVEKHTNS